ncbi:MAG: isoprenylcysteine carboxylmethyltransferase family protein [Acidobacteriaceae bacterium]|jgi:protein-S-isoprenylcysteine O-methyltransferase Ste14
MPATPLTICGYLWIAWYAVWIAWAFQSKKTQQRESIASRLSYTFPLMVAVWLLFFAHRLGPWWHHTVFPATTLIGWFAVALTALGFALTLWARYILGGNWSGNVTIKVAHELIRTGPYRFVRHPIYTGITLASIGTAIALDQWRGVVAVVLLWLSFTIKRLKEEEFMRQTFGDQYTDYARTTGAIFPMPLRRNP